jgi:16S rRNA processing protein RimM
VVGAGYLPVARVAKPHGLKGEVIVFVLTEQAGPMFVPGLVLTPLDAAGRPAGAPRLLERGRPYHRRWLLKFEGVDDRAAVEGWREVAFGVPAETVPEPADGALADYEIPGASVRAGETVIGMARMLVAVRGGSLLVVDRDGRELLVPYRAPILVRSDRARREIVIDPPPGLLEL